MAIDKEYVDNLDTEVEKIMNWYFTFMFKQPLLKNRFVKITGTANETRDTLYTIIGDKWGFQYDEEAFLPQIEHFHLTEVSLDELEKNPQLLDYNE
jgi:hypothetical protein